MRSKHQQAKTNNRSEKGVVSDTNFLRAWEDVKCKIRDNGTRRSKCIWGSYGKKLKENLPP